MDNAHIREIEEPAGHAGSPLASKATEAEEKEDWKSYTIFLLKMVIVVLIFRTFIFTSFNIPSESMMPRLLVGDYLFSQKWSYGYSRYSLPFNVDFGNGRVLARQPDRGDIVIFKHPIDETDYIKRVIGLPGDTVQMIDGIVHIDGEAVSLEQIEDFVIPVHGDRGCRYAQFEVRSEDGSAICQYPQYRETLPEGVSYNIIDLGENFQDNTPPVTVPEDRLFLMGDNRDNSLDSRFPAEPGRGIGLVPQNNLVAEASFMYWSTDGTAEWLKPWTWFTAARWSRMFRGI